MSTENTSTCFEQPKSFKFTDENLKKIKEITKKYPEGRQQSAVLPALYIAQDQSGGWISKVAMDEIAQILNIPNIKVYEVATFYSMFNLQPVGKYHLQICGTTPCWLRGSDKLFEACNYKLGIKKGETSSDGLFTLSEVECLGACVNAPVVQINNENYYEDLNEENFIKLLDNLKNGNAPKIGSQIGRQGSCPEGGSTTLKNK
ncbi:MAG: NADH-quinone oxidoreductase subunit NuoE [Sphingobacteriia bacterium]|nr:NADH-quinone oxidoreductase subunit NuoE [Sphingobacteriia bacterium]